MRGIGIAFLAVGIILLVYGFNASDSFASNVKETLTGNPTDRSIWLIVGGAALVLVGGATFFVRPRRVV
jgi:hypothetical protein